jgi:hypothetical protein
LGVCGKEWKEKKFVASRTPEYVRGKKEKKKKKKSRGRRRNSGSGGAGKFMISGALGWFGLFSCVGMVFFFFFFSLQALFLGEERWRFVVLRAPRPLFHFFFFFFFFFPCPFHFFSPMLLDSFFSIKHWIVSDVCVCV